MEENPRYVGIDVSKAQVGLIEPVSCKDGPALTQEVQMEENPRYVGIDVSKAQVDVAVRPTGQRWAASYNETGVARNWFPRWWI